MTIDLKLQINDEVSFRVKVWEAPDSEKETPPFSSRWKHASFLLPASNMETRVSLESSVDAHTGVAGFDNIVFTTNKKCSPRFSNMKFFLHVCLMDDLQVA